MYTTNKQPTHKLYTHTIGRQTHRPKGYVHTQSSNLHTKEFLLKSRIFTYYKKTQKRTLTSYTQQQKQDTNIRNYTQQQHVVHTFHTKDTYVVKSNPLMNLHRVAAFTYTHPSHHIQTKIVAVHFCWVEHTNTYRQTNTKWWPQFLRRLV